MLTKVSLFLYSIIILGFYKYLIIKIKIKTGILIVTNFKKIVWKSSYWQEQTE